MFIPCETIQTSFANSHNTPPFSNPTQPSSSYLQTATKCNNYDLYVQYSFTGIQEKDSASVTQTMTDIRSLQELITKFKALNVDPTEFACIKGIVIFKTGE